MSVSDNSWVTVEEYLLFVLTHITGHSVTKIASYFMDLGMELSGVKVDKAWSQKKLGYVKTSVTSVNGELTVRTMRGYYPDTPIAYQISSTLYGDDLIIRVTALEQADTMHFDFKDLREAIAQETILNDIPPNPKLSHPKAITPKGMTPQRYKPRSR